MKFRLLVAVLLTGVGLVMFNACESKEPEVPNAPKVTEAPKEPKAYKRCAKCHGEPGAGGTRAAPDLKISEYSLAQFKMQVQNGSNWEGRPPKKQQYRKKKMPAQRTVKEEDIETIYKYIHTQ